jgi:hypothetical protein
MLDLPLAAATGSDAILDKTVSLERFGTAWIDNEQYEIWLLFGSGQRAFLLKLDGANKSTVFLCDVRYELHESEYSGMAEIKGLTHGDIDEIVDAHSSRDRSGRFE